MDDPVSPSDLLDSDQASTPSQCVQPLFTLRGSNEAFAMTIEIKDGEVGVLRVRVDDDPRELAEEFAKKHGLDSEQVDLLVQYIMQNQQLATKSSGEVSGDPDNGPLADEFDSKPKEVVKYRSLPLSSRTSVHERLYQHRKKAQPSEKQAPHPPAQKSTLNYGNWLYIRGMQSKEALKILAEKQKETEDQVKKKEMTFQPAIDRVSSLMTPRIERRTEDLLFNKAAENSEKLAVKRSSSEQRVMKECSFVPKITKKAQRTASTQPRFSRLYEDANSRREKSITASTTPQYPFRPKIYATKFAPKFSTKSFLERITRSKKRFEAQIETVKQGPPKDSANGQTLFHPVILSPSKRSHEGKSVHDYLYSLKDQKKDKLTQMSLDLERLRDGERNMGRMTNESEKYLQQLKTRAFKHFFGLLDADSDGLLTASSCDTTALEPKAQELLRPVLKSVKSEAMSLARFTEATETLLQKLTPGEKAYLLRGNRARESLSVDREVRGRQVSGSHRKSRIAGGSDIYTRSLTYRQVLPTQHTLDKLKSQLLQQEEETAQSCTFRPFTVKGRRSYYPRSVE